jgi:hypothetical protein
MAGFKKAKAEQAAIKMGLYGPAGSGKTFTSLLFAEGLARVVGKRVAFVDTERGTDFYCKAAPRSVHPEAFDFDAMYTRSLTEILSAVKSIDQSVYGVLVIDSITHVWEAARAAYSGKVNAAGQIPFHAGARIKKPYKELVEFLLNSPLHVFICGRQGLIWEEDEETGEMKNTGTKMKAEGETPHEPHILLHMECRRTKGGEGVITAFAEKDRTGTLQNKVFENPDFNTVIKPILSLLGNVQGQIIGADAAAVKDAEVLDDAEAKRAIDSEATRVEFTARFSLCKTKAELKRVSEELTAEKKATMISSDVTQLREAFREREKALVV